MVYIKEGGNSMWTSNNIYFNRADNSSLPAGLQTHLPSPYLL